MNKTISHTKKKINHVQGFQSLTSSQLNLQYQLSRNFLKQTSEKLFEREAQLMMESSLFLDTISKNNFPQVKKQNIFLDHESTGDSQMFDFNLLEELNQKKPRMFSRRSVNHSNSKSSIPYNDVLRDIKENCSKKTYTVVNDVINEKKTLQRKFSQIQNKEKTSRKRIDVYQKNQEFALILTTKNKKLQDEIRILKEKLRKIQLKQEKKITPIESVSKINITKTLTEIKKMFNDRENSLTSKHLQIASIQENILRIVSQNLIERGCERCCMLMKKLKSSLLGYRQELQKQGHELKNLAKKYQDALILELS